MSETRPRGPAFIEIVVILALIATIISVIVRSR